MLSRLEDERKINIIIACREWDLQNPSEVVFGKVDINGHVGRQVDIFEGVHGAYGIGKRNVKGRRLL